MRATLPNWGIRILTALILLVSAETLQAQVSITALPFAKTDDFNAYNPTTAPTMASTLPTGWTGSGVAVYNGRGTGTNTAGAFYAFGTTISADYSAGALRSGSLVISYTVGFTNNSGGTITDLTFSWNYEQWRFANTSGWNATGTGALASNTTLNGKDFTGSASGTTGTVATTAVAPFTLSGLSIAPGQSFGITWATTDATGADNGVSIDDFNIQASGVTVQNQTITFNPLANAAYGDTPISLTATASSGLSVSYASSNTNVATVSGSTLTIVGAGSTNITASQAGNGSYNPASDVIQPFTVNPKNLTVTGATAQNKIYSRTTDATISGGTAVGTVNGDVITIGGGGTFDDFNIGTAKPVTAALTLSGIHSASYTLTQPTGLSADITKKDLTVPDAEAQDKLFDGNTDGVITGTLSGVISPDSVTFNGTGTFASSAVADNIIVTSTSSISGDASNYNLVQPTGLTANIYEEALLPQTIDFNPLANVSYGDANFNLGATASSGLTVAYSSSDTNVATVSGNTVTIVGAGTTTITATQDGNGTYAEATPVDQSLTVNPKALTVDSALANNKIYSGNNAATFTGTLNGVINSDDVTLNATGTFVSVTVANGISVISTATLGGTDAGNYTLTQPTGLSANITVKTLTANSATANNKVYNGNTNATLSNLALTGIVGSDNVTASGSGAFASPAVANGILVTTSLSLSGTDAFNYTLTQPTGLSANITALGLTISGLTGNNKVYNRTTPATLSGTPALNGVISPDAVSVSGTPVANFNTATVGTNKPITVSGYTLSGADAGNYTVSQPTGITANITQASVTISSAVAQNKPFDGNTNAVITGTLSGVIAPDVVTLVGTGTFASSAVGTGIAVTSTSTLSGAASANYTINPQPTGLTANITPGPTVLAPGDLAIIGFNVNAPDNFAFVSWVDIDNGTYIKFTDNAFLTSGSANAASNGRGGEMFVIWRNNGATIPAGTVITIQDNTSSAGTNHGAIVSGNLTGLAGGGDNIFAYQGSATSGANPDWTSNANPATFNGTVLFGLQMQGSGGSTTWLTSGTASSNNSYLPSQLNITGGNIALAATATRGQYTGPRNSLLSLAGYKSYVTNPAYWTTGSNAGIIPLNTTQFELATAPTASVISGTATICAGDSANISVNVTGGTAPYVIEYTDGTNQFMIDEYISGNSIEVMPSATATYTLVSVTDNNALVGTNNSGSATVTVNQSYDFYADADGDGYGTGSSVSLCATNANTPPAGYAVLNGDCNDAAASIHPNATEVPYNGVDDDCDGTIDETGTVTTTLLNTSCGTTLASIGSIVGITTVVGHTITGYRIRATNGAQVQTIETNVPHFTMTQFASYAYATTYTIEIQLQRAGIWQASWGTPCFVSTPAILEEGGAGSINPSQCGITLAKINTLIATTSLAGVTGYRFRVTNLTDISGPNAVQTLDRPLNWFSLQMLTRYNYGTLYRIEVAVKTTGDFGGFGSPCEVSSPASPSLTNCGGIIPSKTTAIAASSLTGITQYRFQITRQSDNASSTIDRSVNWFNFNMVPAATYTAGAIYGVRVAVMTAGTWSPFGDACEITAPGGVGKGIPVAPNTVASAEFKATVYPNPFTADFSIDLTSSATQNVQVKVYDMLGRMVESKEMNVSDDIQKLGSNYPSGVYNVIVSQGENVKTLRVVKR
jgi:hypothetical protein